MNYELKPCPFCGGTNFTIGTRGRSVAVICDFRQEGCGASGRYRDTEEKAVEAWNRRELEEISKIEKGRITETMLGREDHGIMTLYLLIEFEKSTYAYGGYALDTYDEKEGKRIGATSGIQAIAEILNCVGVTKWEDLTGSFVRCEHQEKGGKIIRIGNLIEDKWFSFEAFFKETKEVVENERKQK